MFGVLSLELVCCLFWCPLRPDPCMPRCWLSLLSFFCVRYVRRRRFFSFSLSHRCWGNPNPFGVWDSPCVSPTWPRTTSSTRTPCSTSSPRFRSRSCFFFVAAVVGRWYGCGWWRCVCFRLVGWFFGAACPVALHARRFQVGFRGVGRLDISRPILDCDNGCLFGACGWGPRSRASLAPTRSHPHPLPAERCKGQPRKGVGDNIGRQPYCHTVG